MVIRSVVVVLSIAAFVAVDASEAPVYAGNEAWRWECVSGRCEKFLLTQDKEAAALSLPACKMFCNDFGNMWPRPTVHFQMGDKLAHVNRHSIDVLLANQTGPAADLMRSAANRFKSYVQKTIPENSKVIEGGKTMMITIDIKEMDYVSLKLNTNEGYTLTVEPKEDGRIHALIQAENFFGARNGLETLEQFFIFDNIRLELQMIYNLHIIDKPVYPYRGILLDTARNFHSVESIKRTLEGMATSKLNTFHWHITDSHSFSFESKSNPNLSKLGAITPRKIYSAVQIADVVQYGLERGIRVMPEFDAPAHVGEGWQGTNLTVCFKAEPWTQYCVEPPCGQLDPTQDRLYDVLEGIYTDMFELFKPDIFHMGGDEVKNACWNSSKEITNWMKSKGWNLDDKGFLKLWDHFQKKAEEKVYKVNGGQKLPLILWTSTLTEYKHIDEYLNKDDYIIQVWTTAYDEEISGLLNKGYRLILSNYDALYLDCGFGAWVGEGNNWCSPFIGWQKVYDNSPAKIAGQNKHLIIGSEAALWSEQADSSSLDNRLWPRAGALAERLWAEPDSGWRMAERRFLHYRQRLVKMGIAANTIQPEWCYQNEGYCYA